MLRAYLLTLNRGATLLALLFAALFASTAQADEPRLSISGYDPVAYFTDGKAVQGKAEFEYVWHKLRWRFASGEHRDLFIKDPQRYAPQYDGYCAMGASIEAAAHKDTVDPEAWAIVDGKLYLVHNNYWLEKWREKAKEYIKQADKDWQAVADLPDPVIVGSPCAASPPTTAVITARREAFAGNWRPGPARRGRQCRRERRYAGADRASRQECRRVPQGRRRNCQRHCLYG